jgi:hypothetical protein
MIIFPIKSVDEILFETFMSFVFCSTNLLVAGLTFDLHSKTFLFDMMKELSSCELLKFLFLANFAIILRTVEQRVLLKLPYCLPN